MKRSLFSSSSSAFSHWHFLIAAGVCLLVFGVRAWYYQAVLGGSWSTIVYPDEKNYYAGGAQFFLEQGWSYFLTPRSLWNAPLNVLWTSVWFPNYFFQKVCNLLILSLSGLLVWDIARRTYSLGAAYLALLWFSAYLPFCHYGPTILSEPLFVSLLLFSMWMVTASKSVLGQVLAGMVLGFATLVRPTTQFFPLFLIGLLTLRCLPATLNRTQSLKPLARPVFQFIIGFLLVVGPWSVKNVIQFGTPSIANGSGAVLYLGNDLRKDGDEPIYSEMEFDTGEVTGPYIHLDSAGDKKLRDFALASIASRPWDSILLTIRKAFRYLLGAPVSYFFPFRDVVSFADAKSSSEVIAKILELLLLTFAAVFAFGSIGFVRVSLLQFILSAVVLYMILLHALAFPIPRLALPIFPFLIILGVGPLLGQRFSVQSQQMELREPRAKRFLLLIVSLVIVLLQLVWNVGRLPYVVSEKYTTYFGVTSELVSADGRTSDWVVRNRQKVDLRPAGGTFGARYNQVIFLEVSGSSGVQQSEDRPQLRVLWQSEEDGKFKASRSKVIELKASEQKDLYRIVPSLHPAWKGNITSIRLRLTGTEHSYRIHRAWVAR